MLQAKVEILVEVDEQGTLLNMSVNAPMERMATLAILNAASKLLITKMIEEDKAKPQPRIVTPFPVHRQHVGA